MRVLKGGWFWFKNRACTNTIGRINSRNIIFSTIARTRSKLQATYPYKVVIIIIIMIESTSSTWSNNLYLCYYLYIKINTYNQLSAFYNIFQPTIIFAQYRFFPRDFYRTSFVSAKHVGMDEMMSSNRFRFFFLFPSLGFVKMVNKSVMFCRIAYLRDHVDILFVHT